MGTSSFLPNLETGNRKLETGNGNRDGGAMKTGRSAALPLLFAAILLAAGTAALLFPVFSCPPCGGKGFQVVWPSKGTLTLYRCRLCEDRGRIRGWTRLRADPSPDLHRGALTATASFSP